MTRLSHPISGRDLEVSKKANRLREFLSTHPSDSRRAENLRELMSEANADTDSVRKIGRGEPVSDDKSESANSHPPFKFPSWPNCPPFDSTDRRYRDGRFPVSATSNSGHLSPVRPWLVGVLGLVQNSLDILHQSFQLFPGFAVHLMRIRQVRVQFIERIGKFLFRHRCPIET